MCGIFAYIGSKINVKQLEDEFMKTFYRGPDNTIIKTISSKVIFGFHRLSIVDKSFRGNQPLYHPHKPFVLICNGEIYNHEKLKREYNIKCYSNSDCEVILYMYEKFGESFIKKLDGVFSLCLYDGLANKIVIARDPFGIRPLFFGEDKNGEIFISSEMKSINELIVEKRNIAQFRPGCYRIIELLNDNTNEIMEYVPYFDHEFSRFHFKNEHDELDNICRNINNLLTEAVRKRLMSERPIGCLLSGGLDSSLISAIVAREFRNTGKGKLKTFSIGLKGSTDLMYAKKVADFIGSEHHTVELTEEDFLKAIPEVIYNIESYDTTTVRASVGNYLIGKYIKENTDITVVFNGDGSDEQSGYIYLANAPSENEFHAECEKLLKEIHYFDVLRSDRSLSSRWSLETRTPFLDKKFVQYYMSIPTKLKMYENQIEKFLLRRSFKRDDLLPEEVLWRRKEAFSDGCSSNKRSWHKIIQEHVDQQISTKEFVENKDSFKINKPYLKESYYYRKLFSKYYPNCDDIIPHFWLPNWCGDIQDPSARELNNYDKNFDE